MKLLVTGGAGFIGSNFVRHILQQHSDIRVANFDKLTYAGNLENLADVSDDARYRFIRGDVADSDAVEEALRENFDAIVHFAAESHVDRSLEDATPFLRTNILGTQTLLETARRHSVPRFLHISTDEVYGSAPAGTAFDESAPLAPTSPYAASKAAADLLVLSYVNRFSFPAITLRCTNNYGPYQFPEKLVPLMIANALEDRPLPVYGDGLQERDWLYIEDHCRAIDQVLHQGQVGETYNVGSGAPQTNLHAVRSLLGLLGKPESLIRHVEDRPGHDRRYALDGAKLQTELGWEPSYTFEKGLEQTVEWYRANSLWLERCRSGEYRDYYRRQYGQRKDTS